MRKKLPAFLRSFPAGPLNPEKKWGNACWSLLSAHLLLFLFVGNERTFVRNIQQFFFLARSKWRRPFFSPRFLFLPSHSSAVKARTWNGRRHLGNHQKRNINKQNHERFTRFGEFRLWKVLGLSWVVLRDDLWVRKAREERLIQFVRLIFPHSSACMPTPPFSFPKFRHF